jgi:polyvinyl alcohol dehydrogenase (cytochrome)
MLVVCLGAGQIFAQPPAPTEPAAPAPLSEHILCSDPAGPVALGSAQWNGWGRGIENTRYQPEPAIRATDVGKLALKWSFGYPGNSALGQPTIVDGRVFVASSTGRIYALDARTGCTYWSFDAAAGVSTAISVAELGAPKVIAPPKPKRGKKSKRGQTNAHLEVRKPPSAAFFGDDRGSVYAIDAEKGTLLWKAQIDTHPLARIAGSPTLYLDRLYVAVGSSEGQAAQTSGYACCTFRGSVASLDISTGRIVWKTYLVPEEPRPSSGAGGTQFGPSGVAVEAAPTVDSGRSLVYVATDGAREPAPNADAVVALDLIDGKIRWAKQLQDGGASGFTASPILRSLPSGKQIILAGQRSGTVYGLDPDGGGEILWQTKAADGRFAGAIEWGPAADHHTLYAALAGTEGDAGTAAGSLTAIEIKSGTKRWQSATPAPACSWGGSTCPHGGAQAVTVIPGVVFAGSMDGHLRAYSTIDGRVLWDYDTAKDFTTVNRVPASGGSLDHGGPTIVNGVVYVNSGGGEAHPGNALLAFSVDGK